MNTDDIKLKIASAKIKLDSLKALAKSNYLSLPNAPKVVFAAALVLIGIVAVCFYVYPFVAGSIADYFAERTFKNTINTDDKQRAAHEANAKILDNQRVIQEKEWSNFQTQRAAAEQESDNTNRAIEAQEGEYQNAKNGNTNVDTNLSLDERVRRVLRTDRQLYPNARSGGNTNRQH